MKIRVRTIQIGAAAVLLAGVMLTLGSQYSTKPAQAQQPPAFESRISSFGPLTLNSGDSALIGLLLPAVQRVERGATLRLLNSSGKPLVEIPIAMGDGSVRTASYKVS